MRPRTLLLFAFVALLGAVDLVVPARAGPRRTLGSKARNRPKLQQTQLALLEPQGDPRNNVPEIAVPFKSLRAARSPSKTTKPISPTDVIWKGAAPTSCTWSASATPTKPAGVARARSTTPVNTTSKAKTCSTTGHQLHQIQNRGRRHAHDQRLQRAAKPRRKRCSTAASIPKETPSNTTSNMKARV